MKCRAADKVASPPRGVALKRSELEQTAVTEAAANALAGHNVAHLWTRTPGRPCEHSSAFIASVKLREHTNRSSHVVMQTSAGALPES